MLSTVMVKTLRVAMDMRPLKMSLQAQNMSGKSKKLNKRFPEMHLMALLYTVKNTATCL
jgi:hypothetical protein